MTKGSPDYKKRLISTKGACVAPSVVDLVTLGGKAKNAAEKYLVRNPLNDIKGVKSVKNQMTI